MATRSFNKVFILGNLTRDPELRYTAKGTAICTFGVATNREWTAADSDQVREDTQFHNIVAWGKLAELCSQLLYKGRRVFIIGRLNTVAWDDQETGRRTYRTEIVCEEMIALGGPRNRREEGAEAEVSAAIAAAEGMANSVAATGELAATAADNPKSENEGDSSSNSTEAASTAGGEEDIPF